MASDLFMPFGFFNIDLHGSWILVLLRVLLPNILKWHCCELVIISSLDPSHFCIWVYKYNEKDVMISVYFMTR